MFFCVSARRRKAQKTVSGLVMTGMDTAAGEDDEGEPG